jgi:hypothetical protein
MKRINTTKTILAGAALAGLIAGGFTARSQAASSTGDRPAASDAGQIADEKGGETHDCKGHNSCKGKGGCKSGDNGCAGKNTCKGKGGCGMKDGKPTGPKK